MVGVADPVEAGFTASLARPGGNITGTAGLGAERGGKIIELIREALPSARRVAVLANPVSLFTKPFLSHIELAARAVDMEIQPIMLRPGEEFDAAFAEMRRQWADAVLIQASLTRKEAVDLAPKHQVPSFSLVRELATSGGLMSYSASFAEQLGETARYVEKILKGGNPANLPVAQPSEAPWDYRARIEGEQHAARSP
jgi:putative ABC transport system substrate-binding protein